uniref:Uncharacterized protein n=1 Tax=Psilocybe cubensis TaxID=181762 RepID=A0A8H7XSS9_PSICU
MTEVLVSLNYLKPLAYLAKLVFDATLDAQRGLGRVVKNALTTVMRPVQQTGPDMSAGRGMLYKVRYNPHASRMSSPRCCGSAEPTCSAIRPGLQDVSTHGGPFNAKSARMNYKSR